MPIIGKFIITLVTSAFVVSGTSLFWPRLTSAPMPEALQKVREFVLTTATGKQAAQTLGVSDDTVVEPINIQSAASEAVSTVVSSASEKVQKEATKEVIIQVVKKIETLNPDQQEEIKDAICK